MHHGVQAGPMSMKSTDVHFGSAQRSFVPIRWCIRQFCMFVINSDRDGAQYDVWACDTYINIVHLSLDICSNQLCAAVDRI